MCDYLCDKLPAMKVCAISYHGPCGPACSIEILDTMACKTCRKGLVQVTAANSLLSLHTLLFFFSVFDVEQTWNQSHKLIVVGAVCLVVVHCCSLLLLAPSFGILLSTFCGYFSNSFIFSSFSLFIKFFCIRAHILIATGNQTM